MLMPTWPCAYTDSHELSIACSNNPLFKYFQLPRYNTCIFYFPFLETYFSEAFDEKKQAADEVVAQQQKELEELSKLRWILELFSFSPIFYLFSDYVFLIF